MMDKTVIHRVLERVTRRQPDGVAIRDATGEITHGALNVAANQLAWHLRYQHGVQRGDRVGLYLPPGINYVIGVLAAAKAGGVFVPLDPGMPAGRQLKYLAKVMPAVIVTEASQCRRWAELDVDLPLLRLDEQLRGSSEDAEIEVAGDDGSYIMFTSGSTGEPKAILGSQKGLSHFIHWEVNEFGLDATVRVSQLAASTFDVSLRDIFVPLLAGGTLCIPDSETRSSNRRLLDWLEAERISMMHCVPSMFRGLLDELESRSLSQDLLTSLRQVLLAGEPLFGVDVGRWRAAMGDNAELVNLYGPSETTLAKAFHRIRELTPEAGRMIPVGGPLPNTALLIIKDDELCDPGEIGELYIRTPFMSKGYYGDPDLTEECFVQNPLTPDTPDVVYRTGDLGRYRRDRTVELIGRRDSQVKVKGVRVQLGEIEQALLRQPSIEQAVVVGHAADDHQVHLTAYFVASGPLSDAELRDHLSLWLPPAIHPAFFVPMASFPVNLHGKVNRRALPRPVDLLYQRRPWVGPANVLEAAVGTLWAEVLDVHKIGVTHTFAELGGDSLKGLRLISRIFQRFGVEFRLQELFPAGTVRDGAVLIGHRLGGDGGAADRAGAPATAEDATAAE